MSFKFPFEEEKLFEQKDKYMYYGCDLPQVAVPVLTMHSKSPAIQMQHWPH